jgi:hypothetical protein
VLKRFHQITITGGGIAIAACFIFGRPANIVATVAVICLLLLGGASAAIGRALLPRRPIAMSQLVEGLGATYDAIGAMIAAVPFYGAAKLPSVLPRVASTPKQVLAVSTAVAVVEFTRALSLDGDLVERGIGTWFKGALQQTYLKELSPSGPFPIPNSEEGLPDVWLNVFQEDRYGGWSFGSRHERARAVQAWINDSHPSFLH